MIHIKLTLVYWSKKPAMVVKLNSDRCALNNLCKIGEGGVTEDHNSDLIYAYTTSKGDGTNNQIVVGVDIWGLS